MLPFFQVIEDSGILPHFTLSHEPGVGFAADAAARFHCGLGVAVVTYGAGAFNLVNAVAGAYAERSPVVVIAGAPGARERASGFVVHHQARSLDTQMAVFREITCDQAVLTEPETAPADIARVLRSARERSLPVYIELPRDLTAAPADAGARAAAAVGRSGGARRMRRRDHREAGAGETRRSFWSTWRSAATTWSSA